MSNAMIKLPVIPPRMGHLHVAFDSEGLWFVRCDYFHRYRWVYDTGLMTTQHVEKLTGVKLEEPRAAVARLKGGKP
jgi:hypothetical protein